MDIKMNFEFDLKQLVDFIEYLIKANQYSDVKKEN
jgi:hypothetical protein